MVCPICDGNSFDSFRGRSHAQCDSCKSLERHRLIWLFVRPLLSSATSVVHIAPEACLTKALRNSGCRYVSGDLVPSKADSKIDIRHMKFKTGSVDLFICSHVLEHVLDDFTAMREIVRVLAPGGMAILQVPLVGNHTFRDPTANTAEKRKRAHGQHNHVRVYGELDYAGLLGLAGLQYSPETPTPEQVASFNLSENSSLHLCYKPT